MITALNLRIISQYYIENNLLKDEGVKKLTQC